MLWLAIHLPALPLEVFLRGDDGSRALAVVGGPGGRQRVVDANGPAEQRGVRPGLSPTAAYGLLPDLDIRERDARLEEGALADLAAWAGQFTPRVSLEPGRGLLLEIEGSLSLFKGLDRLWRRVRSGLADLGFSGVMAVAPTPLGAWLLAVAGDEVKVGGDSLEARLAGLSLHCLELPPDWQQALEGMGITCLGDLLSMPRAALARRFAPSLPERLDRALGRVPDPRPSWEPPPVFQARLALPAEVTDREALRFPLQRLILQFQGYLRARDAVTRGFRVLLQHRHAVTRVTVGLVAPAREAPHLLALLRVRLERTELPAPVLEVALESESIDEFVPQIPDLFDSREGPGDDWRSLLERLQARLGPDRVRVPGPRADHRPEQAWEYTPPVESTPGSIPVGRRPLWLLETPRPLEPCGGHPCFGVPLALRQGPERIEGGWWDGADVSRDYYVAEAEPGRLLWIYRDRRSPRAWFLHGFFG